MDELTKAELARIRDEDQRQNRRIELLEDMSKVIQDLVLSIHGLAKSNGTDAPGAERAGEALGQPE